MLSDAKDKYDKAKRKAKEAAKLQSYLARGIPKPWPKWVVPTLAGMGIFLVIVAIKNR